MIYEPLQKLAGKTGLPYHWLRELAVAGKIPVIRTSPKGKWLGIEEDIREAIQKMQQAA